MDDGIDEADENFILTLAKPINATLATAQAVATIVDDDAAPVITVADIRVSEADATARFTATLSVPSSITVTFDYATKDGTAKAGNSYVAAAGTITIPAGETTADIEVTLMDDGIDEADETFILTLAKPLNATLATAQAVATIIDDDATPTLTIAEASAGEADLHVAFTATLSAPAGMIVSVDYQTQDGTAKAGSDYKAASGTLAIPVGQTTATIQVPLIDNTVHNDDKSFALLLSAATNAALVTEVATGTIVDDDEPTVTRHWPAIAGDPSQAVWNIYLKSADIDGIALEAGDELALYDGNRVVGTFQLQAPLSGSIDNNAQLVAWSKLNDVTGYAAGNSWTLRCWDNSAGREYVGARVTFDTTDPAAYSGDTFPAGSAPFSAVDIAFSQGTALPLRGGYQFVSLPIQPDPADMQTIFTQVGDSLDFVRDSSGATLQQAFGDWRNNIGNWSAGLGYLVKMTAGETLFVRGNPVSAMSMDLTAGFHFLAAPADGMTAATAFADLMGNGLDYVRDSDGNILQNSFGSWIDGIGTVQAGEGLLVKMSSAYSGFRYPTGTASGSASVARAAGVRAAISSQRHWSQIMGDPSTAVWSIYLVDATIAGRSMAAGDEVAIFDGDKLVGSMQLSQSLSGSIHQDNLLKVWRTLAEGPGYTPGNSYTIKLYDAANSKEHTVGSVTFPYAGGYAEGVFPTGESPFSAMALSVAPASTLPVISIAGASVLEGGVASFTVNLSVAAEQAVKIDYAVEGQTATLKQDVAAASGTLTIPAGLLSGEIQVQTYSDRRKEGDESFLVRLANPIGASLGVDTAVGIIMDVDAKTPRNVVYTLDVRGTSYGDSATGIASTGKASGSAALSGKGYLVLDLDTRQIATIVKWRDGIGEVHGWDRDGMWYTADTGTANYWFLTSGPAGLADVEQRYVSYSYAQLHGAELGKPVDIGAGSSHISAAMTGLWRGGYAATGARYDAAALAARIDVATTRDSNIRAIVHEDLVDELRSRLGISAEPAAVDQEAVATAAPDAEGLVCYQLSLNGIEAGNGVLRNTSFGGYLVLDIATGQARAIVGGRDAQGGWYRVDDWSEGSRMFYQTQVRSQPYLMVGNGARRDQPSGLNFRLLYGASQHVRLGGANEQPVAFALTGEYWNHSRQDGDAGVYSHGSIQCRVLGEATLTLNRHGLTLDEAVNHLEESLPAIYEKRD